MRRYLYGESDEKFVTSPTENEKINPLGNFKFQLNPILRGKTSLKEFNKSDLPIVFKYSPETLLNLCVKIIDAMPLPMVYTWNIEDICKWLREIGYRQYQNTFRVNLVTGRTLLLLDASALSAMNIKDYDHIKDIARGIRSLFYFEMTKFGRSISLYPEFHREVYKLLRTKSGAKYDIRPSDLWRKMQLIREKEPYHTHWEILERWLNFESGPKEMVGGHHRINLYACNTRMPKVSVAPKSKKQCTCLPPCECYSSPLDRRPPWRFKCLPHLLPDVEFVEFCENCLSPCTCRWSAKKYSTRTVLTLLQTALPSKYGGISGQMRYRKIDQMAFRFSLLS